MPANLTIQYHKAEQAYRQSTSPEEELKSLQLMLREIPKHKGTDKLQAELKQKISKLKKELITATTRGRRIGFRLPIQGAGRAVIIGGPNCGKSQLLTRLTHAAPVVAAYPYTTHEPCPGMMPWEDVAIQLIDTPPISLDLFDPTVRSLIRSADLILLLLDLGSDDGTEQFMDVLKQTSATKTRLSNRTYLDRGDIGVSYTRTFVVPNKIDLPESQDRLDFFCEFCPIDFETYPASAETGQGLDELRKVIFESMDVVRVYTKSPNAKEPDFDKPFTIRRGGTLLDVAQLIHKDIASRLKHARVWGSHVHDGTIVKADYVLHDKDIVEIHC